jgi:hypothetical protein
MANKALSTRQKMMIRSEPAKPLKPRGPVALALQQRMSGTHRKPEPAQRETEKRLLEKLLAKTGKG